MFKLKSIYIAPEISGVFYFFYELFFCQFTFYKVPLRSSEKSGKIHR